MVGISDVVILSVDKNDDVWEIEGEINFDGDLASPFSAQYSFDYDDLEDLNIEITPGRFDKNLLKEMIKDAVNDFEE